MKEKERKAYVCVVKGELHKRVFLLPGDKEPPRCEEHGTMTRQANMKYPSTKDRKGKGNQGS